jgi:hypothetical protein
MRKIIMIFLALALWIPKCHAIDIPEDLPTIEALISLHKNMKSAEDDAMKNIAVSYGEQSAVKKKAINFNDVRTTLNSKLNNAYSYVLLAAALSGTANSLYKLIKEYANFTSSMTSTVTRKPMVGWYYTEAVYACSREIKNIKALYATMTASNLNIMKASMDEKLNMIFQIKTSIDNMLRIIADANFWCSCVAIGGFAHDYIWDILNSEVTKEIAEDLITKWNAV